MAPDAGDPGPTPFETELDLLLSAPEVNNNLHLTAPTKAGTKPSGAPTIQSPKCESSSLMAQRSKKRATAAAKDEEISTKRVKLEPKEESSEVLHVHPARRVLVALPKDDRAGIPKNTDTTGTANTPTQPPSAPLALRRKNAVQRQWDPSKDADYGSLLDQRRKEKLSNIDRYVPGFSKKRRTRFPLERLPEKVLERVFDYLLIAKEPITVDFYWLRSFIRGHAREPNVMQKLEVNGTTYSFPIGWNQLLTEIGHMKEDMLQFKKALEMREAKTRSARSPCRGLSVALLKMSRKVQKVAAKLDSFLITIGSHNAKEIQHLRIHAPMWHRLIQEDFVEGAMIDCLSPATRLAVMRPCARDRVLSAIENTTRLLSTNIKTLAVELATTAEADNWTGRYVNDRRMIAASDADEHAGRKTKGIKLLKALSAKFPEKAKPTLTGCNMSRSKGGKKGFHNQIPSIKAEAAKYGWWLRSKT